MFKKQHRTNSGRLLGQHAIVIGGSIAGMLAARVLSDHFARVTVIERDRLPNGPEHRKGAPQARHNHQLLVRGAQVLEELLPGIGAELSADGALSIDCFNEIVLATGAGEPMRLPPGPRTFACSRPLLEWAIRRRVTALPQVEVLSGTDVTGLIDRPDRAGVAGVYIRQRTSSVAPNMLRGDLVVDAGGKTSRAPEWLVALGYPEPEQTTINPMAGYASRTYALPAGQSTDWKALFVPARPPASSRSGLLMQIEDGRMLVTLSSAGDDRPSTDEEDFLAFARSLPHPAIADLIGASEPLGPISGYQRMENQLRHYDRMERWPEGFVALGDSVCAFNPIFAQGMTVAALGAQTLGRCLRAHRGQSVEGLARGFQRSLAKVVAMPWLSATSADRATVEAQPNRPSAPARLMQRYMDTLLGMMFEDPEVYATMVQVSHMITSPIALYRPALLAKVWRRWRQERSVPPRAPQVGSVGR
ncbi:MAG TPA: FAD-dependent monooxygenase [Roseiflexaceae bacterium]|nr:FAD-dependent monooxygenase [Roseiflexaceae bacterium]